jgi:maleylpyruvate isomerase
VPATLAEKIGFVERGTELCASAIASLDEHAFAAPSQLPGWTRRHVVAHLSANAEAIGRLLHWARTGERTPMYASPEQRVADIEAGARRSGAELAAWFERSAAELAAGFAAMTDESWRAEVVTAQGRTVAASETPWMRGREVLVHAVDLGTGITFADLPAPFLEALRAEILARRAAEQLPELVGDLPAVTAYLAGRGADAVTTADGQPAPVLSAWL